MGVQVALRGRQQSQGGLLSTGQTFLQAWYLERAIRKSTGPRVLLWNFTGRTFTFPEQSLQHPSKFLVHLGFFLPFQGAPEP